MATHKGRTHGGSTDILTLLQHMVDVKNGNLTKEELTNKITTDIGKFSLKVEKKTDSPFKTGNTKSPLNPLILRRRNRAAASKKAKPCKSKRRLA